MRSPADGRQRAGRGMKYLQVKRYDCTMSEHKKRKNDPESVRRRLENSLPWALSRWFSRVILGRDLSKKK